MADRFRKHGRFIALGFLAVALLIRAEELPDNQFQAVFNGYFDNFRVNVLYPTVSVTKQIGKTTSVTGRYLVDGITAASMRSRFEYDGVTSATTRPAVDGVTSASVRGEGENEAAFDDVRHEFNAGVFQLIGNGSVSLNGIFSTEHDYKSYTVAAQASHAFAKKNTVVQIGFVRSWDRVSPDTRTWTKNKDVVTGSLGLTQVLGERLIAQANASVTRMSGFLSEPYQPVPVFSGDGFVYKESVMPDTRLRKAAGLRANWMWFDNASLQLGYRYYWDDWGIRSHTVDAKALRYFAEKNVTLGLGVRLYGQTRADFFKAEYGPGDALRTVDPKLDACVSDEWSIEATVKGDWFDDRGMLAFLSSEDMEYSATLGWYHRRTDLPDWFSDYGNLYAYTMSLGFRYRF